jgi:hypothetical protein
VVLVEWPPQPATRTTSGSSGDNFSTTATLAAAVWSGDYLPLSSASTRRYSMRLTLEDCSSLVHTSDVPSTLSMARRIRMTRHPLNADDTAQIASTPGTNVPQPRRGLPGRSRTPHS